MKEMFLSDKERIQQIKRLEWRMKIFDVLATLIGVSTVIMMATESDLYYQNVSTGMSSIFDCLEDHKGDKNKYNICKITVKNLPEESYASSLRGLTVAGSVIIEFCLVMRYVINIRYKRARKELLLGETLCRSRMKWLLLIEMIYMVIVLPPRVNWTFVGTQQEATLTYTLDTLFTFVLLFRVYLIFRVISVYSAWNDEKAKQICNANNCEGGPEFAMKSEMKTKPYVIIGGSMMVFVGVLGFAMKLLEQPYMHVSGLNWSFVWNGMWCIVAVMTTVGYGDFYPRTHLGRCVAVLGCVVGQFFVSIMVVAMSNSAQFSSAEQRAFDKYKKVEERKTYRSQAVTAISSAYRLHRMIKRGSYSRYKLNQATEKLKRSLLLFRIERKNVNSSELSTPLEYLADQFQEKLNNKLDKLYYFGVALKKMQERAINLVACQQAVGDLADKVYSQTCLLHADMSGNGHIKPKIRQTINPKETQKISTIENIDSEARLKERKQMLDAIAPTLNELSSPGLRKNTSVNTKTDLSLLKPMPESTIFSPVDVNVNDNSPTRPRSDSLTKLSKMKAKAISFVMASPKSGVIPSIILNVNGGSESPNRRKSYFPAATLIIEEEPATRQRSRSHHPDTRGVRPSDPNSPNKRQPTVEINSLIREQNQQPSSMNQQPNSMNMGFEGTSAQANIGQNSPVKYKRTRRRFESDEVKRIESMSPPRKMTQYNGTEDSPPVDKGGFTSFVDQLGGNNKPIKHKTYHEIPDRPWAEQSPMERFVTERVSPNTSTRRRSPTESRQPNGSPTVNYPGTGHPQPGSQQQIAQFNTSGPQVREEEDMPQRVISLNKIPQDRKNTEEFIPYWNQKEPEPRVNQKPALSKNIEDKSPLIRPRLTSIEEDLSPTKKGALLTTPKNQAVTSKQDRTKNDYIMKNFVAGNSPTLNLVRENSSPKAAYNPTSNGTFNNVPSSVQSILRLKSTENVEPQSKVTIANLAKLQNELISAPKTNSMRINTNNALVYNAQEKSPEALPNGYMMDKLLGISNNRGNKPN